MVRFSVEHRRTTPNPYLFVIVVCMFDQVTGTGDQYAVSLEIDRQIESEVHTKNVSVLEAGRFRLHLHDTVESKSRVKTSHGGYPF